MAGIDLVTGYQGVNHVTAAQWADFNRGIFGDAALLDIGSKMNVEIQTANQITMSDGVVVYDGREFYIGYGESVNIPIASGTQGMKRNDIVVIQYDRNEETGVESGTVQVVEGTPSENNPQDPAYSDQDIRTGVFMSQKPFCRVRINGTAIEGIDYLVDLLPAPAHTVKELKEDVNKLNSSLEIYSEFVGIDFEEDGGGLENSWGNYQVPEGYCLLNAILKNDTLLSGKYLGIFTQRYNQEDRTVSFYLNWRYTGTWEVLITLAKEKKL